MPLYRRINVSEHGFKFDQPAFSGPNNSAVPKRCFTPNQVHAQILDLRDLFSQGVLVSCIPISRSLERDTKLALVRDNPLPVESVSRVAVLVGRYEGVFWLSIS